MPDPARTARAGTEGRQGGESSRCPSRSLYILRKSCREQDVDRFAATVARELFQVKPPFRRRGSVRSVYITALSSLQLRICTTHPELNEMPHSGIEPDFRPFKLVGRRRRRGGFRFSGRVICCLYFAFSAPRRDRLEEEEGARVLYIAFLPTHE